MPEYYMILARKIDKIPEFYIISARKCRNFYIIIARKILSPNFWGHVPAPPPAHLSPTPMRNQSVAAGILKVLNRDIYVPTLTRKYIVITRVCWLVRCFIASSVTLVMISQKLQVRFSRNVQRLRQISLKGKKGKGRALVIAPQV